MKLAAIVPLNRRSRVKTRLAGALATADRVELAQWLAQSVLAALQDAQVADIGVVSPDDEVLRWAWRSGAEAVRQQGEGLNDAVAIGRDWALARGADALMVVLGDLPLLTAADVSSLVAAATETPTLPSVTMAPDRAGHGTNVLVVRPPAAIPFAFGEDSLSRHVALAREAGIEPRILQVPGAAFDVDTPEDVQQLVRRGLWTPTLFERDLCTGEAS
jgi:2-phospho-L-lactate/phosphoenolpyruvate guanylyltransferase